MGFGHPGPRVWARVTCQVGRFGREKVPSDAKMGAGDVRRTGSFSAHAERRHSRFAPCSSAILLLVWVLVGAWGGAACAEELTGTVTDAQTREPIPGANAVVVGTVLGAATDLSGAFRIFDLPPGVYAVRISVIGYKAQRREGVQVISGQRTSLRFELEEAAIETAPIVVTASKKLQPTQDAPVGISAIDAAELEQRDAVSLDGVLQHSPGVEFKRSEIGIRGSTGYTYGASGSRVLFLIDGNPAITGDTGGINWDALPPTEIESVEIVKGAGSALYGSNALGGVINVITRGPSELPETRIRSSVGAYSEPYYPEWRWSTTRRTFHGLDLSHSRRIGRTGFLVAAGRKVSDGYRQNGQYERHHALSRLDIDLSERTRLIISSRWAEEDRGEAVQWRSQNRALSVPEIALGDRVYSKKLNTHVTLSHVAGPDRAYVLKGHSYGTHWTNHLHDSRDDSRARRLGGEGRMEWVLSERQSLTLGTETAFDRVDSRFFGDHRTWDVAGYVQDEARALRCVVVTVGGRYDLHEVDEGTPEHQLSPKLGVVYRPSEGTSMRGSVGRGFRAPSVAEQFTQTTISGYRVVPNPDLEAERAWSLEVGLNQVFREQASLDVALFQNEYWEMIEPKAVRSEGETVFQFDNVTRSRIRGAEAGLKFALPGRVISGSLGYTYVYPRRGKIAHPRRIRLLEAFGRLEDDEPLAYRSRHCLLSSLSLCHKTCTIGGDFRYASRLEKVMVYPSEERVAQYVVDVRGGIELGKVRVLAKIENLLQYHYTEVERTLAPIRSYTLTVLTSI